MRQIEGGVYYFTFISCNSGIACESGTYCPAGSSIVQPCNAGSYCPDASQRFDCPAGKSDEESNCILSPKTYPMLTPTFTGFVEIYFLLLSCAMITHV